MRVTTYNLLLNDDRINSLIKENSKNYPGEKSLDSQHKIVELMNTMFDMSKLAEEHMFLLCFDNSLNLKGVMELSHGGLTQTICDPRSIFSRALLIGASGIVLVHNHPSGNTEFSQEDINMKNRIKEGGDILAIKLLDHIIICNNEYRSMADGGLI